MLKETLIEDHQKLYEEQKQRSEQDFRFYDGLENVLNFATNMLTYDDVDTLRGIQVFQQFDAEIIAKAIENLNQRKFNLMALSSKYETYRRKEKYFGTEKPNPFKTTNFEIFVIPEESSVRRKKV